MSHLRHRRQDKGTFINPFSEKAQVLFDIRKSRRPESNRRLENITSRGPKGHLAAFRMLKDASEWAINGAKGQIMMMTPKGLYKETQTRLTDFHCFRGFNWHRCFPHSDQIQKHWKDGWFLWFALYGWLFGPCPWQPHVQHRRGWVGTSSLGTSSLAHCYLHCLGWPCYAMLKIWKIMSEPCKCHTGMCDAVFKRTEEETTMCSGYDYAISFFYFYNYIIIYI